jgi:cytochrome c2
MNGLQRQAIGKAVQLGLLAALMGLLAACSALQLSAQPARPVPGGDVQRGAAAIRAYGCGSCHNIPGVAGADSMAGPPLDDWADRQYISGKLPNQPELLIQWVRFPQAIEPGGAMPNLDVTEQDARDISAYLFTLAGD